MTNETCSPAAALSRRTLFALGATAGLATAGGAAAAPARQPDFADPFQNLYAFQKVESTFGDTAAYSGHQGLFYASLAGEMIPLFGYIGYGLTQSRVVDGTSIEKRAKEGTIYTDLVTGQPLTSWKNPFTQETVEVVPFIGPGSCKRFEPQWPATGFSSDGVSGHWSSDLSRGNVVSGTPESMKAGVATVPFQLPWQRVGPHYLTAMSMHLRHRNAVTPEGWPKASTGPIVDTFELFNYVINAADIDDPSVPFARRTSGFTRRIPWLPFMRMGQSGIAGEMVAVSHSYRTSGKIEDVPPVLRTHFEKHYPAQLEPLTSWAYTTGRFESTWTHYAKTIAPEVAGYARPLAPEVAGRS